MFRNQVSNLKFTAWKFKFEYDKNCKSDFKV